MNVLSNLSVMSVALTMDNLDHLGNLEVKQCWKKQESIHYFWNAGVGKIFFFLSLTTAWIYSKYCKNRNIVK